MELFTANLEQDMPTVEKARIRMDQALRSARAKGCKAVKLIHGYGSSGSGGAIKKEVLSELGRRQRAGKIKTYVPGEEFSPFYPSARLALERCPFLSRDRDYSASNHGITIVVL